MLAPLITRSLWTGKRGWALLFPVALGVLVSALLAGCAGTSVSTAPALLVFRDGLGNVGLYRGDGPIVALDAMNGHRLWQRALDSLPPGTHQVGPLVQPTLQEGLVYTPYTYRDPSKPISLQRAALEALDPATGQLRWRHEVAPKQNTNAELDSAPVVANGVVYVSSATFEPLVNGQTPTLHGLVEALDSHNGSMRWSVILHDPPTNPVIVGGLILLRAGQMLVALNITGGSVAWTFTPPGGSFYDLDGGQPPYTSSVVTEGYPGPVVAQQLVFVEATEADSAGHGIGATWFAVKISDGSLAWRSARSAPGAGFTRPVLNQSGSVLCTTSHASDSGDVVMGISIVEGKTLWTMSTPAKLSACAAAGDVFYLTESAQNMAAGGIRALDSEMGRQLWYSPTKPPVIASGVAAPPQGNGLAVVYSPGPIPTGATPIVNTIAVVQLSTGNILWQRDVNGPAEIPLMILGDLVVVPEYSPTSSSLAPRLVAYTLQTGSRTWAYALGQA